MPHCQDSLPATRRLIRVPCPSPARACPGRAISVAALREDAAPAALGLRLAAPLLDRVLGIRALDRIYRCARLQGLPPFEFIAGALDALDLMPLAQPRELAGRVPASGPLLVVCNHPYGGVEALMLAHALRAVRADIKILANGALCAIRELRPLLIPVNPLVSGRENLPAIRQCEAHLARGGLLILFPAGRVASRAAEGRMVDAPWHRLVGHLARRTGAALLPVRFHGGNGRLFHALNPAWSRARMALLPRELLRLRGRAIRFQIGRAIPAPVLRHMDARALTAYARLITDLFAGEPATPTRSGAPTMLSLAPLSDAAKPQRELDALPERQLLLEYRHFAVYHAAAAQIPYLMGDIARERERVFRMHDEGGGQPRDIDAYDAAYTQLFVWDRQARALVGAYRLGPVDSLRRRFGEAGLYLARMFDFDPAFHAGAPMLELGRSFVVPEHQKSHYALYLLWRGIGAYLAAHPRYRRLYGTVSLSRRYDARAIAMILDALIEPSPHVRARHPLPHALSSAWHDYLRIAGRPDLATLSACVQGVDDEGKDVPVLLRHYHKLGARFHCAGIDPNFNDTTGLLLSVDMDAMPEKLVATFLGEAAAGYLAYPGQPATTPC